MPLEIERKYLIDGTNPSPYGECPVPFETSYLVQTYLVAKEGVSSERVRERTPDTGLPVYTHTKKVRVSDGVHHEDERVITKRSFDRLLKRMDPGMVSITKTRRVFEWLGWTFEVDFFNGPHQGLVIMEIELPYVGVPFPLPPFIPVIREVTSEPWSTNAALARAGGWKP